MPDKEEILTLLKDELRLVAIIDRAIANLIEESNEIKSRLTKNFTLNHSIPDTYNRGVNIEAHKLSAYFRAVIDRMDQQLHNGDLLAVYVTDSYQEEMDPNATSLECLLTELRTSDSPQQ